MSNNDDAKAASPSPKPTNNVIATSLCGKSDLENDKEGNISNESLSLHSHTHVISKLTKSDRNKSGQRDCKLCSLANVRKGPNNKKARFTCCYECRSCGSGFHCECFVVYHNIDNYPHVKEKLGEEKVLDIKTRIERDKKTSFAQASRYSDSKPITLPFMKIV